MPLSTTRDKWRQRCPAEHVADNRLMNNQSTVEVRPFRLKRVRCLHERQSMALTDTKVWPGVGLQPQTRDTKPASRTTEGPKFALRHVGKPPRQRADSSVQSPAATACMKGKPTHWMQKGILMDSP